MNKKDGVSLSGILQSRGTLIVRIAGVALLANLFFIGLACLLIYRSYQRYEQAAMVSGQNLALVLSQQIDETFEEVNLTLLTVADDVEKQIAAGGIKGPDLMALLTRQHSRTPVLDGLRITNAAGRSIYGTDLAPGCPVINVGDRPYFIRLHGNPGAGMVISQPLVCRISGKWSLLLARRIDNLDGSFGGIVYGAIALSHFSDQFSTLDVGLHGTVSLRNSELEMIARSPELTHYLLNANGAPVNLLKAIREQGSAGHYWAVSKKSGGMPRLFSYRKTERSNLYVNVGLDPQDYLTAWRGEVLRMTGLVTIFVLGSLAGSLMVYRNAMRGGAALQALARQSRLRQLLMEISSTYINLPLEAVDTEVNASLGELAEFVEAERAYIFRFDSELRIWACTYEWRVGAGDFRDGGLHDAPPVTLPSFLGAETMREPVNMEDVSLLPEGELRETLERQGVKALLAVPITTDGECAGMLGFDSIRGVGISSGDEQRLLTVFAGMLANVWKRRRSEERLMESNRHLARADAAKSEFLANMSHEIRTPMNGVLGMVDLLATTELDGEQTQYIETARASGEILLTVLNDILDFSKIEAGKLDLESIGFDLLHFVDDFVGIMAVRAKDKHIVLACSASPEAPRHLRGDPVRLRQILMNLTDNAVKFTTHGEVIVRVGVEAETPDDVLLRFTIRDTGMGIPQDKIGLLFTKFTQVDSSTTRQHGGTGLGLAICKQLVLLMGGDIGVRSVPGHGSEFWFTVRMGREPGPATQEAPGMVALKGTRVLTIEGHPVNREILRNFMQSWGMRIEEAPDWKSALEILSGAAVDGDPFAVAILDAKTQETADKLIAAAISDHAGLTDVRWVVLTSLRGGDRYRKEHGIATVLTKPLRRQEVLQVMLEISGGVNHPPLAHGGTNGAPEVLSDARILVVEDNGINQKLLVNILKRLGLSSEVAGNGVEAVKALETSPYDLVLMDVQMPEMDGFRATQIIRDPASGVRDHRVPVIAMTAHAMHGNREECLLAGMNDYVSKPIKVPALVAALERWLKPERRAGLSSNGAVDRPPRL